jgi:hypothetical protein
MPCYLGRFLGVLSVVRRLRPWAKVFVQRDLGPYQIAAQVTRSQFSCQVRLGFPHAAMDRSVVVVAFISFVIAAEIDSDEPSAIVSRDDLANSARQWDFLLPGNRGTQLTHSYGIKVWIFRLIE